MNLVMIVSDTFRWDYLGAYGNQWIHTPNLDALAAESAVFLDAFAEGLPTIPARRVIMTGRNIVPFSYRPQQGDLIQQRGWHPLYDEDVTLGEHLQERGYFTAFFNDVYHMMKPGKNFHRGFDQWFWIRGQEADPWVLPDRAPVEDLISRACRWREWADDAWPIRHLNLRRKWKDDADTLVAQTLSGAADWVRGYSLDKPFYLHVECFDPHEPWDPPAADAVRYEPNYGDSLDGVDSPLTTDGLPDARFANIRAAYAGEVTLVDRWVGRLLDALRETGRMADTLVLFTSDHGCMMGEQGEIHKRYDRLRNQVTQVPLLVRHPNGDAAGKRVKGFCQHQDLMPTVLSLLGEPVPDRVLGRDLWPQVLGDEAGPDYVVSAFCDHACIRTSRWNYLRPWTDQVSDEPPRVELYDLQADPEELTDVIADHPALAKELAGRLEDHLKRFAPLTAGSFQHPAEKSEGMTFDGLPRLDL